MPLRVALPVGCLVGVVVAVLLGGTWSDRLADHRGFHLVAVPDQVTTPRPALGHLPRRAALVVIDGLGFDEASTMQVMSSLRQRGQCLRTYVGALSVSQPVYAVLSTGLEQDRTGARNNEPPLSLLRAETIWQVARQAGLSVSAVSELSWWQRLMPPDTFSTYLMRPRHEDYFAQAAPADLMLIHPIYVDEAGHQGGAASAGYGQAVERVDHEIAGLMQRLDLTRDLLVVTADHGHTLRGGHGGEQDRVTHVLTCYAGPGIRRSDVLGQMRTTSIAPSLALFLGLRFPAHMRAGLDGGMPDDDLDVLWQIADPATLPAAYLAERKQAVSRFRQHNRDQLARWPGAQSSWRGFYHQHRMAQLLRGLCALFASLGLFSLLSRYPARPLRRQVHHPRGAALCCAGWASAIFIALYLLTVLLRGSFDATAINQKQDFIRFGFAASAGVLLIAAAIHLGLRRSWVALRADALALLVLTTALCLCHPLVFGLRLGFPIPPSAFIYLPYFSALFLTTLSLLCLPLCLKK